MDTTSVLVTIGGLALIVVVLWFFFGEKDDDYGDERVRQEEDQPEYACPMHPWIISKDPAAVCSICGMKLVWRD